MSVLRTRFGRPLWGPWALGNQKPRAAGPLDHHDNEITQDDGDNHDEYLDAEFDDCFNAGAQDGTAAATDNDDETSIAGNVKQEAVRSKRSDRVKAFKSMVGGLSFTYKSARDAMPRYVK